MSTVEEIEAVIEKLPPGDVARLAKWLAEYDAKLWDKQIEEDAVSGRLGKLWKQAETDIAGGQTKPLDEFLDNP